MISRALLARAQANDGEAWRQLDEEGRAYLLPILVRRFPGELDEAGQEDALQNTWLEVRKSPLPTAEHDGAARGWLRTIAIRCAFRWIEARGEVLPEDSGEVLATDSRHPRRCGDARKRERIDDSATEDAENEEGVVEDQGELSLSDLAPDSRDTQVASHGELPLDPEYTPVISASRLAGPEDMPLVMSSGNGPRTGKGRQTSSVPPKGPPASCLWLLPSWLGATEVIEHGDEVRQWKTATAGSEGVADFNRFDAIVVGPVDDGTQANQLQNFGQVWCALGEQRERRCAIVALIPSGGDEVRSLRGATLDLLQYASFQARSNWRVCDESIDIAAGFEGWAAEHLTPRPDELVVQAPRGVWVRYSSGAIVSCWSDWGRSRVALLPFAVTKPLGFAEMAFVREIAMALLRAPDLVPLLADFRGGDNYFLPTFGASSVFHLQPKPASFVLAYLIEREVTAQVRVADRAIATRMHQLRGMRDKPSSVRSHVNDEFRKKLVEWGLTPYNIFAFSEGLTWLTFEGQFERVLGLPRTDGS